MTDTKTRGMRTHGMRKPCVQIPIFTAETNGAVGVRQSAHAPPHFVSALVASSLPHSARPYVPPPPAALPLSALRAATSQRPGDTNARPCFARTRRLPCRWCAWARHCGPVPPIRQHAVLADRGSAVGADRPRAVFALSKYRGSPAGASALMRAHSLSASAACWKISMISANSSGIREAFGGGVTFGLRSLEIASVRDIPPLRPWPTTPTTAEWRYASGRD